MNKNRSIVVFVLLFFSSLVIGKDYNSAKIAIDFSPSGDVANDICNSIGNENGEVLILASKFSSKKLEECLVNIKNSGRRVNLILDSKFSANYLGKIKRLARSGVCIYSDANHNTAHNKVVIAGNDFVFSGSYNFTDDSEFFNSENAIFIKSNEVNQIYKAEFFNHLKHSRLINFNLKTIDQCPSY